MNPKWPLTRRKIGVLVAKFRQLSIWVFFPKHAKGTKKKTMLLSLFCLRGHVFFLGPLVFWDDKPHATICLKFSERASSNTPAGLEINEMDRTKFLKRNLFQNSNKFPRAEYYLRPLGFCYSKASRSVWVALWWGLSAKCETFSLVGFHKASFRRQGIRNPWEAGMSWLLLTAWRHDYLQHNVVLAWSI